MKFILYVKKDCPFCDLAAEEILKRDIDLAAIEVVKCEEILSELKAAYNWNTVPMVFLQQESSYQLIGGYDSLKTFLLEEDDG